jgi:hypothetical protein
MEICDNMPCFIPDESRTGAAGDFIDIGAEITAPQVDCGDKYNTRRGGFKKIDCSLLIVTEVSSGAYSAWISCRVALVYPPSTDLKRCHGYDSDEKEGG